MRYEDNIRKVVPYTPGEQPRRPVTKLNTNECPYPPSPKVEEALRHLDLDAMRRYPDPACSALTEAIAKAYSLAPEQVFVGVGSDDVLSMCFLTYFHGKAPILFPDITYSFYDVWASVYDIPYRQIPLKDDFTIDPADYQGENGGIVFANPNAPTGLSLPLAGIEAILRANPDSVVIVDEAYVDFGGETALPLLPRYENLVITRTMSKSRALAGLRVGYAFASPKLIRYLSDVKFSVNSYTMNLPSLVAGKAAIEDQEYFDDIIARIVKTREWTKDALGKLGFTCLDSKTNFLFAHHPSADAGKLFEALKEKDIFVRYFEKPRISDYLRISIGKPEDMQKLVDALAEEIKE